MFSHVMVGANDFGVSRTFYDALLGAIGVAPGFLDSKGRVFWSTPTGNFAITRPIDGEPACHANGGTIGFRMADPAQADAWHAAGIAAGGAPCEEPPGWRDSPLGRLYLAYLRDPSDNKLCAVYRPAA
jgi:catechol 2,3-dioxygenase-like lactoylglutathione lyase family enzyme